MKSHYIFIVVILLLQACKNNSDTQAEEEQDHSLIEVTREQFNTMKMESSVLAERAFDIRVKASGKIDVPPQKRAKVTSYVDGFVKSVPLLVGDRIQKGMPLLTLESPEYLDLQQSYLEAKGQLDYLRSEYDRQKILFSENISSQKKYLETESGYKVAEAVYEGLRRKLLLLNIDPEQVEQGKLTSSIVIRSPISGDITAINVNVGMAVSPMDVVMEIVDTQALHLELFVFEKDIFIVEKGQPVRFSVPQVSSGEFEATVSLVGKSVEGNERTIHVYCELDHESRSKLMAGMYVEAGIVTSTRTVPCIPYDALVMEESNKFVLVLESQDQQNMTFRKTLISTGEINNDWVEIIPDEKINQETQILTKGAYDVI